MTGGVIILQSKSMDWFLYDNGLRHERVKAKFSLILFLTASMDYSILKSSLSSDIQLSSLKLLHKYARIRFFKVALNNYIKWLLNLVFK